MVSLHILQTLSKFFKYENETTEPRAQAGVLKICRPFQEEKDVTGSPWKIRGGEESEKLVKYFEDKYGDSVPSWGEKVDG